MFVSVCRQGKNLNREPKFHLQLGAKRATLHERGSRKERQSRCRILGRNSLGNRLNQNSLRSSARLYGEETMPLLRAFSGLPRSSPVQLVTALWRLSFGGLFRRIEGVGANRLDNTLSPFGWERPYVVSNRIEHCIHSAFVFAFCLCDHATLS